MEKAEAWAVVFWWLLFLGLALVFLARLDLLPDLAAGQQGLQEVRDIPVMGAFGVALGPRSQILW